MKCKQIIKSVLAGTLAAMLLLTGCGETGSAEGGTQSETVADQTEAADDGQADEVAEQNGIDLSEHVTLVFYLYGSEQVGSPKVLEALNEKLTADINTSLEIKYIDWGDIATKYPLLWASGEYFDMAYASREAAVPFQTLAEQGSLYDMSGLLDKYAPTLKKAESETGRLAGVTVNGSVFGIPNLAPGFNVYGFVYNKANCDSWGIDYVTDLETMKAYCEASVANGIYPFNGNSEIALDFYHMLVGMTGNWVFAPGIPNTEMYLVADYDNYQNIIHPAFTDEFEEFVTMLDEWEAKGYWPSDVMSSTVGDKEMYKNEQCSSYIAHMPDWTGNYNNIHGNLENQDIDAWHFAEDNNKVVISPAAQDLTVINVNSKYPERCMMVIERIMTDESYYRLMQYGIEGVQYEAVDGYLERPESYDEDVDASGFSIWAFNNNEYTLRQYSEHPTRYELNEKWTQNHIDDPYEGFNFNQDKVSAELSAIANVNSQLGAQLMLGKTEDVKAAVEQYRDQLTQAGIDTVIDEVKAQLAEFEAKK